MKDINIKNIKNPKFLKDLSYDELTTLSEDIRKEILEVTSTSGGHLSSNLGVVELTIALHRNFDFLKDKLIFDVGHQCYTHKILTGRDITKIRTSSGYSGFINRKESPYDIFESGHSSTSLSAALGFALARSTKEDKNYDIVTLTGDSSIVNGVALEALNDIASRGVKIIVVLNDNDMAIMKPSGTLGETFRKIQANPKYAKFKRDYKKAVDRNKLGHWFFKISLKIKNRMKRFLISYNIFDELGFAYIGPVDGHDFKKLDQAFSRAKKTTRPVVVHVKTLKGKGYEPAEFDQIGYWHGVTPFDLATGKPKDMHPDYMSWSHLYSDLVLEKLKNDPDFYLLCPGTLKGSGLESARQLYPNRVIDAGIAEEHIVLVACTLASEGKHVCVSIYSTFMQRAFDQIEHDVARNGYNITFLVDRSGLIGSDGETHQGIYDESFLLGTPKVIVSMARNASIAKSLFMDSFNMNGPKFIRYPRTLIKKSDYQRADISNYITIQEGKTNCKVVVVVGPYGDELTNLLTDEDVTIIDPIYVCPISDKLVNVLTKFKNIVIVDIYGTENGFANILTSRLVKMRYKGFIYTKCAPLEYVKYASIKEQLEKYEISASQVATFIKGIK